jgi:hypothetical protein
MDRTDSTSGNVNKNQNSVDYYKKTMIYWYSFISSALIGDAFVVTYFNLIRGNPINIFGDSTLLLEILIAFSFVCALIAIYSLYQYNSLRVKYNNQVTGKNGSIVIFLIAMVCLNSLVISSGLNGEYSSSQGMNNSFNFIPNDNYIILNTSNQAWNPGSDIFIIKDTSEFFDDELKNYLPGFYLTLAIPNQPLDVSKLHVSVNSQNKSRKRLTNSEELMFDDSELSVGKWSLQNQSNSDSFSMEIRPKQQLFPGDQYEVTITTPDGKTFTIIGYIFKSSSDSRY